MTSPFGMQVAPVVETQALPDTFVVDVLDEDIQLGAPSASRCPIYRAAVRELFLKYGLQPVVGIGMSGAAIGEARYDHDGVLFVSKFDSHLPVEPRTVTFTRIG